MADEIPYSSGKKRVSAAVRRTQSWLTKIKESSNLDWTNINLIGVVVGKNESNFAEGIASQVAFLLSKDVKGLFYLRTHYFIFTKYFRNPNWWYWTR